MGPAFEDPPDLSSLCRPVRVRYLLTRSHLFREWDQSPGVNAFAEDMTIVLGVAT